MEGERTDSACKANGVTEEQAGGRKPLHRFLRGQPKFIGVALLFFGCNEMMLGLALMKEITMTSTSLYTPFWQAALFMICGSLSVHTYTYPSKKLVTVCLSMYIVTIIGGFFSISHRLICFDNLSHARYEFSYSNEENSSERARYRYAQLVSTEAVLLISTICVIVLLFFLCCFAKASLRSSNTQVIIRQHLNITDTEVE